MQININKTHFLVGLFENYSNTLYRRMRKNKYKINDILDFIDGYLTVVNKCNEYIIDASMAGKNIAFDNYRDLIIVLSKVTTSVQKDTEYNYWQIAGMDYAYDLANYYIKSVLFGNDDELDEDDFPYISLPDKDLFKCSELATESDITASDSLTTLEFSNDIPELLMYDINNQTKINVLDLSARSSGALYRKGIMSIADLIKYSPSGLKGIYGLGEKSIKNMLDNFESRYGIKFKDINTFIY